MTILEPNKHQGVNQLLWSSAVLLLMVTGWSIVVYNETVLLHHELGDKEAAYQAAMTKNAGLKNERYAQTEGKMLRGIAEARGLVKVRNPEYVKIGDALFAQAR